MSALQQLFLTVFGAIIILTLGQVIIRFVIEPIQKQRGIIGTIASSLIFYANIYSNSEGVDGERIKETSVTLRRHASDLASITLMIPVYCAWEYFRVCPQRRNIRQAIKDLTFLSNKVHTTGMEDWISGARRRIEKALGIEWFDK